MTCSSCVQLFTFKVVLSKEHKIYAPAQVLAKVNSLVSASAYGLALRSPVLSEVIDVIISIYFISVCIQSTGKSRKSLNCYEYVIRISIQGDY